MNIHEYQAKQLLNKYGVPISTGAVILNKKDINRQIDNLPATPATIYVVKAQIHAGGRGNAGGVKILKTKHEAKKAAHEMLGMNLITHQTRKNGQKVNRLYIEVGCDIIKEYYFSVIFDRNISRITIMASTEGGVNIEEVAKNQPEKIVKASIDPVTGIQNFHCRKIANGLNFQGDLAKEMHQIVKATYEAFVANDANQIEINPLALTKEGYLLALDAKINFDDNSLFRNPDILALRDTDEEDPLEIRAANAGLSYIKMDGSIGCMVNGAGLAMATMDIIKLYGSKPANFLDVGGGADRARVTEALKIILSDTSVKSILVNIFGGIMRCDIIAEGIIAAIKDIGITIPLVVRLAGTNVELGKSILSNSGLSVIAADNLADAAQKVVAATE